MIKIITFTKVKLPYGWLSNMSPFPVDGWKTAEHMFQAERFAPDDPIRGRIAAEASPMAAKMVSRACSKAMVVEPHSDADVSLMRHVLVRKVSNHPDLKTELLNTDTATLVEDVTKRQRNGGSALFWGMAYIGDKWVGHNTLGVLWMSVRENLGDNLK